tara:strand:+ start:9556 stop:10809 length:1254 start_codon:yes stop_codon:yes gene_type:complete
MANKILIEGEKGIHGGLEFKGDLITKPIEKAMDGYVKSQNLRSKNAAIQAGKVDAKALKVLEKGSFEGTPSFIRFAGEASIREGVGVYRKNPNNDTEYEASQHADDVNYGNEAWLKENKKLEEIIGDTEGEIDLENMPNLSAATPDQAVTDAINIFGNATGLIGYFNEKSKEYDVTTSDGRIIKQSDIMDNIFIKNVKFGTMIGDELKLQGSKTLKGQTRRLDYNKFMTTKGQIVSAFHDNAVDDIPSPNEHFENPSWAQVDSKDFDINKVKEETKKYYNSVLVSEQANYLERKENEDNLEDIKKKKNSQNKRSNSEKEMDILYKKAITENVNGDFTGMYGDKEIRKVEWKDSEKKSKDPRLRFLYDRKTGDRVGTFNFFDNPVNKPYIYTTDNTHMFFDPDNSNDFERFKNRMKQL